MRLFIFLTGGLVVLMIVVALVLIRLFRRRCSLGQALVITSSSGRRPRVRFSGALVLPVVQRADLIDITSKTVEVTLDGPEALVSKDGVRIGVKACFYVRVNPTQEDVLKVATSLGCARASDGAAVAAFFRPKLVDALRVGARQLDFEGLQADPARFRDTVIQAVGKDLDGFTLEDVAIERLARAVSKPADEVGPFR